MTNTLTTLRAALQKVEGSLPRLTESERTNAAAALRTLIAAMEKSEPAPPLTEAQYTKLAHRLASRYRHDSHPSYVEYVFQPHTLEDFVRAIEKEIKNE